MTESSPLPPAATISAGAPPAAAVDRTAAVSPAPAPERLVSLDALRGFDMFWIVGAEGLVAALAHLGGSGPAHFAMTQLEHAPWQGFTFYDLIFPLFLFIVGVSIVLSMEKARREKGLAGVWPRIVKRSLLLFVLGIIYSGGVRDGWDQVRWLNVLQRIGIVYGITALLYCALRPRALLMVASAILVGYWALLTFVPIKDINLERTQIAALEKQTGLTARELYDRTTTTVRGGYEDGKNLAHHLDFEWLPGRKYDGLYDPEGIVSTIPSVATCLLGVFVGFFLRRQDLTPARKAKGLALVGVGLCLAGLLWGVQFPIVKRIWTSSFVLYAGGWSCLSLAAFYQIIEVWQVRRWAIPFIWLGMNPIAIYLVRKFMDFDALAARLVGGPIKDGLGAFGPLLVTLVGLALSLVFVWYLHRRRIFLRL